MRARRTSLIALTCERPAGQHLRAANCKQRILEQDNWIAGSAIIAFSTSQLASWPLENRPSCLE